eukprot:TRINITY_DN3282_c0_g1_i2.p1 TRINITY_DN3282_c0_g1~~TRINITY_DN3282_c0_g1_i2.p1  ORF type:complete len:277 (+),score=84.46 TRINITY_DN3282_c0_g1_i2:699-1529(+)
MDSHGTDNIPDMQRKRAILSNLLAKLNISGTEARELFTESGHRRKIQPNISEETIRRSSSASVLNRQDVKKEVMTKDDSVLELKAKEGMIKLKKKAEEGKEKARSQKVTQKFFDAGAPADITKSTKKPKAKKDNRMQVDDVNQPYAPLVLPLSIDNDDTTLAECLVNEKINQENKYFLMQFPRVLPISHLSDNSEHESFNFFKNVAGKLGKCRVYKSGRVEMVIEGVKYDVNPGVQSKVRQELAAVSKECRDIYLLTELRQKIVVTPNIESLLDNN